MLDLVVHAYLAVITSRYRQDFRNCNYKWVQGINITLLLINVEARILTNITVPNFMHEYKVPLMDLKRH